ncbi:hypothetical protein B0H19DRAFT_1263113 [Mycena capillaripes]|nr:hypothetical protein B0H19DRAFT_1263113 [Mycena capillaripes]
MRRLAANARNTTSPDLRPYLHNFNAVIDLATSDGNDIYAGTWIGHPSAIQQPRLTLQYHICAAYVDGRGGPIAKITPNPCWPPIILSVYDSAVSDIHIPHITGTAAVVAPGPQVCSGIARVVIYVARKRQHPSIYSHRGQLVNRRAARLRRTPFHCPSRIW